MQGAMTVMARICALIGAPGEATGLIGHSSMALHTMGSSTIEKNVQIHHMKIK